SRRLLLALLLLGGFAWEASAFEKSQDHYAPRHYAPSQARRAAAEWAAAESRAAPLRLLANLGYRRQSDFEWLCAGAALDPGARRVIALIPWEALPALGHPGGRLRA